MDDCTYSGGAAILPRGASGASRASCAAAPSSRASRTRDELQMGARFARRRAASSRCGQSMGSAAGAQLAQLGAQATKWADDALALSESLNLSSSSDGQLLAGGGALSARCVIAHNVFGVSHCAIIRHAGELAGELGGALRVFAFAFAYVRVAREQPPARSGPLSGRRGPRRGSSSS